MLNYFNIKMKNITGMFTLGEGRVVWVVCMMLVEVVFIVWNMMYELFLPSWEW